ncbi:acyl-CoA N-acyltransferase [Mycena maculata]|uniref:Acyl-CoA N-acyltransferase n=1 Tax=Mycena maculata TaxID=230809 RepID=A0AAD7MKN9_9AGAR|nr:acyl-CoA N-acyltransferase [Mycena maculata]
MSNPRYEVFPISVPVSDEDVTNYSRLRLLGLKTNPEAFGSTFAGESTNTRETWRARIDTKERFTVIARLVTEDGSTKDARKEWVGTASVLTPEMARSASHVLVGMWVHPEHRRKGLGKRLIEVGIEWVRARTEGMTVERRQLMLEVHRGNDAAKALYGDLGFVELKDFECHDAGRIPLFVVAN